MLFVSLLILVLSLVVIYYARNKILSAVFIYTFILSFLMILTLIVIKAISLIIRKRLIDSHINLQAWINANDVGDAKNIVEYLENNDSISEFFKNRLPKFKKQIKEDYEKEIFKNKNSYLLDDLKEILKEVNTSSKENLLLMKNYMQFENPKSEFWNKVLGLGVLGILCSGIKFGVECLGKIKLVEIGFFIIIASSVGILLLIIVYIYTYIKKVQEKRYRNFIELLILVIEEEDKKEKEKKLLLLH